jgi:hypothetical protein
METIFVPLALLAGGLLPIQAGVTEEGFRDEFLNDVRGELAERIPPDLWKLHWALMTPQRREIAVGVIAGLKENLAWFPKYQAYLREHRPPTLVVWGRMTATCRRARGGPTSEICRTLSFTSSMVAIGRWKQTSMRSWR